MSAPALRLVAATFFATMLAACDHINGIAHVQALPAPADVACAERALRSTEGITGVSRVERTGSARSLTLRPLDTRSQSFIFSAAGVRSAVLQFNDGSDGARYRLALTCINCELPQSEIDAFIPVMRRVEQNLAAQCGMDLSNIERMCNGVNCDADDGSNP